MTTWEKLNSPVTVGFFISMAFLIGVMVGHAITFRTCYFLHYWWGKREEKVD